MAEPFFHLRSTHHIVDEVAGFDDVVLYVGAGASIERTGLTWEGLAAQLLDPLAGDYKEKLEVVKSIGALAASSAIAEHYRQTRSSGWRFRLSEAIRDQLYRGPRHEQSYFNDRVVALANAFMAQGRRVIIATPNYDQFLLDAIKELEATGAQHYSERIVTGMGVSAGGRPVGKAHVMNALRNAREHSGLLTVIYLHGFVGHEESSTPDSLDACYPVVSEADYAVTRKQTQTALGEILTKRHAIITGTSLTDPPLLHALVISKKAASSEDRQRLVIRPTQGRLMSNSVRPESYSRVESQRSAHLGVRIISPSYFYQAPQLLEEIEMGLAARRNGQAYSADDSVLRYGYRLNSWWQRWFYERDPSLVERQAAAHRFLLHQALPEVRRLLGSASDEPLRLEAWVRWKPDDRKLALWASSAGTWPDFVTMRSDAILDTTQEVATRAYLNGASTYARGDITKTRWKSFLARPVRYLDPEYDAFVPVGVVSVASMLEQTEGSLNPRMKIPTVKIFRFLESIGLVLFDPDADYEVEDI